MKPRRRAVDRGRVGSILVRIVRLVTSPSATIAIARSFGIANTRVAEAPSLAGMRTILILRPDGIGDVVMTGPVLRELRRAAPLASITLVVSPRSVNFVETCPYVDKVLTVEIPPPRAAAQTWWRPLSRRAAAISIVRRHLYRERYDLALVPRWGVDNHEASVLAYLSGATRRVAYSEHVSPHREKRNRGYDRYFTILVHDRSVKHEVERNLHLLSALHVEASDHELEAWPSKEDAEFADSAMAFSAGSPAVAVGPGAGSRRRAWPVERFIEVGQWVIDHGGSLVVLGGAGEDPLGHEVRRSLGSRVLDLTNKATIRESTAVLKRCEMFCGNDAGPMHLAAAAGIPVVEVSCHPRAGDALHANSPTRFGPWGVPHRVVQPDRAEPGCDAGCVQSDPHCILNVSVDSVMRAMDSLLKEASTGWANAPARARLDE